MPEKTKSIYKQYEDATRDYYGADKDPLKFVPVVTDENVAHELALKVESRIANIDEEDLAATALRAQRSNRMPGMRGSTDLDELRQEALDDRLRRVVVSTELDHAAIAPSDFGEDAQSSGAYGMATGHRTNPRPQGPPPTEA